MGNVYEFRKGAKPGEQAPAVEPSIRDESSHDALVFGSKAAGRVVLRTLHTLIVLAWPFLKWALSIFVALKGISAMYHWNDSASYAGWEFLGYFALLVVLTCLVNNYRRIKP